MYQGRPLIDWASDALAPWTDNLILCGRDPGLADRPAPDLGPLGGLNSALHDGRRQGFDAVLTIACDIPFLPDHVLERLVKAGPTTCFAECPVIGLWDCALADMLDDHLRGADRSMRAWVSRSGAIALEAGCPIININTIQDLDRFGLDG